MSLYRLNTNDGVQIIGDLYGIHKSLLPEIVREYVELLGSIHSQFLYRFIVNYNLWF